MLNTVLIVLLIMAVVVLVIGLVRIMIKTPDSVGGFILELLCLDLMGDLIVGIFHIIGELLSELGD